MSDIQDAALLHRVPPGPDRGRLFELATEQGGYFTAEQARSSGYGWALLSHHVKSGRFIRIRRGLYRFTEFPSSRREDVLVAWLAVGKKQAVVSHESALDLLDLSDLIPNAAHLTVPRSRRNLPSLPGVTIHTTVRPFRSGDLAFREGMVITSATRSILDAAEAGAPAEQIELAVVQAVERGLAVPKQLCERAALRGKRVASLIEGALQKVSA